MRWLMHVHSFPSQNISMHTATIYFLQLSVICLAAVIFHVNCMHTSTSLTLASPGQPRLSFAGMPAQRSPPKAGFSASIYMYSTDNWLQIKLYTHYFQAPLLFPTDMQQCTYTLFFHWHAVTPCRAYKRSTAQPILIQLFRLQQSAKGPFVILKFTDPTCLERARCLAWKVFFLLSCSLESCTLELKLSHHGIYLQYLVGGNTEL